MMSTYTLYLPKTIAALIFTTAASFCAEMEKANDHVNAPITLNSPVTFRISYFCPKMITEVDTKDGTMHIHHKDVSSLSVIFPNGKILNTKPTSWSTSGGRYTLYDQGKAVNQISLNPQELNATNNPYYLIINIMTGYVDQGKPDSWEPIQLTLNKAMITPQLQAIRITHSDEKVDKDMRIQYFETK